MRLKALTIKNFKGIDENGIRIEFAPITMLFGPNNAGKSTIIQAMHLAREVFCAAEPDLDKMPTYGKGLDLGSFKDYVHKHDKGRMIRIGLEWDNIVFSTTSYHDDHLTELEDKIEKIKKLGLEICIKWDDNLQKTVLSDLIYSFNNREFTTMRIQPDHYGKSSLALLDTCDFSSLLSPEEREIMIKKYHSDLHHTEQKQKEAEKQLGILVPLAALGMLLLPKPAKGFLGALGGLAILSAIEELGETKKPIKPALVDTFNSQVSINFNALFPNIWGNILPLDRKDIHFLDSDIHSNENNNIFRIAQISLAYLLSMPGKMAQDFLNKLLYIGPIRDMPKRGVFRAQKPSHSRWATGMGAWDEIATADDKQLQLLNHKLKEQLELGYIVQRKKLLLLDAESALVPNLWQAARDDLDDLDESALPLLREFLEQEPEIRIMLRNKQTGVETEPRDMGLGVSQVLPVIAATVFAKRNAFIAVEQPELHIHPKLQVNLGDIIIESALHSDNAPLFLIETHSEHLLLRFLRRIRETSEGELPSHLPPITKDMIAVNYIYPKDDSQTEVCFLPITDNGDFAKKWPGPNGFFMEREEEIF